MIAYKDDFFNDSKEEIIENETYGMYLLNSNINFNTFLIEAERSNELIDIFSLQENNIIHFFKQLYEIYYSSHDFIELLHLIDSFCLHLSENEPIDFSYNYQQSIINLYKFYSTEFIFCTLLSLHEDFFQTSYEEKNCRLISAFAFFYGTFPFLLIESKRFIPILAINIKHNIMNNVLFDECLNMILMLCQKNPGTKLFCYIDPKLIIDKLVKFELYTECLFIFHSIASTNKKDLQQYIITKLLNIKDYIDSNDILQILLETNISYTLDKSQFNILKDNFSFDSLTNNSYQIKNLLKLLTKFIDRSIFSFSPDEYMQFASFLFDNYTCNKAVCFFETIVKKHNYFANILINESIIIKLFEIFENYCFKHKVSILHLINVIIQNSYGESCECLSNPDFICSIIYLTNIETEWLVNETLSSILGLLHLTEKKDVETILIDPEKQNLIDSLESYENDEIYSKLIAIRSILTY